MKLLWTEASGFWEQFQYLKSNRRVEDVPPVPAKEVPRELLHTHQSLRAPRIHQRILKLLNLGDSISPHDEEGSFQCRRPSELYRQQSH